MKFVLPGVVLAISALLVQSPWAGAHELKTKKGNRVVKHTHQSETGHATEANNDPPPGGGAKEPGPPNSSHKFGFCAFRDKLSPKEGAAALAGIQEKFPERQKREKAKAEAFWKEKFGDDWKSKVTQEPKTVDATTNCAGETAKGEGGYGDDPGWIDTPDDAKILIDDDYEPNPTGDSDAGCIVVYRSHNSATGPIEHIASVAEVSGTPPKVTKVKSRLGAWGIWTHPVGTVPDSYTEGGGGWQVYRKKP